MKTKDGKYLEYLVQLIEKSISPDSIVERDINLPILHSRTGETTQCDLVIRTGKLPRETLTIVEVQDRISRVKPNDFRGWQRKREEVGAQHLICVSRKEFPKSIKEKAAQSGNTICLITIKELTAQEIPMGLFNFRFQHLTFKLVALHRVAIWVSKGDENSFANLKGQNIKEIDNRFSFDKKTLISFQSICLSLLRKKEQGENAGRYLLKHEAWDIPTLYYNIDGSFVKIGLEVDFEWDTDVIEIPMSILSYEQFEYGALAWVVEALHESTDGLIGWKIPVTKVGGHYQFNNLSMHMPYKEFFVEIKIFPPL